MIGHVHRQLTVAGLVSVFMFASQYANGQEETHEKDAPTTAAGQDKDGPSALIDGAGKISGAISIAEGAADKLGAPVSNIFTRGFTTAAQAVTLSDAMMKGDWETVFSESTGALTEAHFIAGGATLGGNLTGKKGIARPQVKAAGILLGGAGGYFGNEEFKNSIERTLRAKQAEIRDKRTSLVKELDEAEQPPSDAMFSQPPSNRNNNTGPTLESVDRFSNVAPPALMSDFDRRLHNRGLSPSEIPSYRNGVFEGKQESQYRYDALTELHKREAAEFGEGYELPADERAMLEQLADELGLDAIANTDCGPMTAAERQQIMDEIDPNLENKLRYMENGRKNIENRRAIIAARERRGQRVSEHIRREAANMEKRQARDQEEIDEYLKKIREVNGGCDTGHGAGIAAQ